MSEAQTRPPMSQHTSVVFNRLFDELGSMKQQQWTITNYAILLLAAVFALKGYGLNRCAAIVALLAIAFAGPFLVLRIQWHVGRARVRIDGLHRAYFTQQELVDIGLTPKEIAGLGNRTQLEQSIRGWEFVGALIAVLWGGSWLVFSTL
jgi:hypothetical protein